MKYLAVAWVFICLLSGCSGGGDSGGGSSSPPPATTANVLTVSVGAASVCTNVNELCAQITICQPGTSSCQTISHILVDIGSFGLRIFGSVLTPTLSQEVNSQGNPIGECAFFADGTAFWGPVQRADVVLGGEPAVNVPIHVIATTFAGQSSSKNPCNTVLDSTPQAVNFNGILGIGVFAQDCGSVCVTQSNNTLYFSCVIATSSCTGTTVALSGQVQNPVRLLPSDNNGVLLTLPNVPSTGAPAVSGSLILGIGTAVNNTPPASVSVLTTDTIGFLTTIYKGTTYTQSVIDSGSNGYFFPDTTLLNCTSPLQDFYCPPSPVNLMATVKGANNNQTSISFQVANTSNLVQTGNAVFNNLGGPFSGFVWGLPFFLGRTTYIGIESQTSPLGTGPFVAF
jgi:hypothetical protein